MERSSGNPTVRFILEKRPHRFDRLYESNPKEWEFWMNEMGWGHVLDYIGIEWRQEEEAQLTLEEINNV